MMHAEAIVLFLTLFFFLLGFYKDSSLNLVLACPDHPATAAPENISGTGQHTVIGLCFISSVMPEEVTYATLKFPNTSQSKKLLESCSLERTGKRTGKILYPGSHRPEKRSFSYTDGFSHLQSLLRFHHGVLVHREIAVLGPFFI